MKEFQIDIENDPIATRGRLYGCRGDIEQALDDVNAELEERGIDLQFVNIMPGSSDYLIAPVTSEEMKRLEVTSEMMDPDWDSISGSSDWKYYVPSTVRSIWGSFDPDQILALVEGYKAEAQERTRPLDLLASD